MMNAMNYEAEMRRLQALLDEAETGLEEAREERNSLLRERFDLKEQRRYLRTQLREAQAAGNQERIEYLNGRLEDLRVKVEETDAKITELEQAVETGGDEIERLQEELNDAKAAWTAAQAAQEPEAAEGAAEGAAQRSAPDHDGDAAERIEQGIEALAAMLQNALKHVTEKIDVIDFDQVSQTMSDMAEKAAKAAAGAAQEVENACKGARAKAEQARAEGDCSVSGSGVIDGGSYRRIMVSGSCRVNSDVQCTGIRSSGSLKIQGNADCTGEVRSSGSLQCTGSLLADSFSCFGSGKIEGDLAAATLNVPGALQVGGSIKAGEARVTGSLKVEGDCEAESLSVSGTLQAGGTVNADSVNIRLALAESRCAAIGGSQITVTQTPAAGFLGGILKPGIGSLTCDSVEGDQVNLQGVHAEVVRGGAVVIGNGCVVDRVEYSVSCSIDGGANVTTCVRI